MKKTIVIAVLLVATAASAQTPPLVGGKPLLQVAPRGAAKAAKPASVAEGVRACLDIEDGTKERLDCYDDVVPPKPKSKPGKAKGVLDCRFIKEQDERLTCFNGFAESVPKFSSR
jgi:hypothetical protein